LITARTRPLNLADFVDEYQADLKRLIAAKIAGEEIVVPPVVDPPVLNLRDALEESLRVVTSPRRRRG
jgi:non-homologous end joining protein Ku